MSTDLAVIEAALKGASFLPWSVHPAEPSTTRPLDTYDVLDDNDDEFLTNLYYLDAHLIANAPAWLAELVERVKAAEAEVERLARWKSDALPVMDGLQELGRSLGLILGDSITGTKAHAAAEALKSRAESAEATIARVRELCDQQRARGDQWADLVSVGSVLAALSGPESAPESPSSPFPAPEDTPTPTEPTEPILRPTDQRAMGGFVDPSQPYFVGDGLETLIPPTDRPGL